MQHFVCDGLKEHFCDKCKEIPRECDRHNKDYMDKHNEYFTSLCKECYAKYFRAIDLRRYRVIRKDTLDEISHYARLIENEINNAKPEMPRDIENIAQYARIIKGRADRPQLYEKEC